MSGFNGVFATGMACQQGTLTLPDTWFRPLLWDLLVVQLLRPDSSNLPCLNSTFTSNTPWYFLDFAFKVIQDMNGSTFNDIQYMNWFTFKAIQYINGSSFKDI